MASRHRWVQKKVLCPLQKSFFETLLLTFKCMREFGLMQFFVAILQVATDEHSGAVLTS